MTVALLLGSCGGLGIWLLLRATRRVPMPLEKAVALLEEPHWPTAAPDRTHRVPRLVLDLATSKSLVASATGVLDQDLAVCDRSLEEHAVDKIRTALVLFAAPLVAWTAASALRIALPAVPTAITSLVLGAAGWLLVDAQLRQRANARRREFSTALSTYLDLVSILLAGGSGIEQALADAACAGSGWSFELLQRVLADAQLTQRAPWRALGETAESMALAPLLELAAAMTLAGESGARTRESLTAKAESLRNHELTQAESDAAAATEKMGAPVAFLVIGFVALIGYPALATIMQL